MPLLLRGFKRLKGDAPRPKDPLLPADLKGMYSFVDLSDHTKLVLWLIILLAFWALCSSSKDQEHLLRVADISFKPWSCVITVNKN